MLKTFEEAPKEFAMRFFDGRVFLFLDEAQYSKKVGKM